MIKITDVARRAGVAKSTVSNVLTGNKFVSDELRQKVLTACLELDYHPNFYASGLSSRKTNIVALLLENRPDFGQYGFYKDLIVACLTEASARNYSLLVYYHSDKNKLLDTLRQGRAPIDGAVIMSPCVNDPRLAQMESSRTVCVVIGRPENPAGLSYVDIDNKKLVGTVAEKLIADYGNDIYLINSSEDMTISQDRRESFLQVCSEHGINGKEHIFESGNNAEQDGKNIAMSTVKKDAVYLTADDRVAAGVYEAAKEKGFEVGKDVAVFSLGRSQPHGVFFPRLSYASQDYTQLGKLAVDVLINEIESGEGQSALMVQSDIVYRESTERQSR